MTERWYLFYSETRDLPVLQTLHNTLIQPPRELAFPTARFGRRVLSRRSATYRPDDRAILMEGAKALSLLLTDAQYASLNAYLAANSTQYGSVRSAPEGKIVRATTHDSPTWDQSRVAWGLQAIGIEGVGSLTGDGVRIGVLDSGYGPHSDFPPSGGRLTRHSVLATDPSPDDPLAHGTRVIGIIAGPTLPSRPRYGIAPGARVYSAKVINSASGNGWEHDLLIGLQWAVANGCRVINVSLGDDDGEPSTAPVFEDYCRELLDAGVVVIASAGNNNGGPVKFPARCEPVIAVGAVASRLEPYLSTAAGHEVDIGAPGEACLTSTLGASLGSISDTSAAAPFVSGVAALYLEAAARAGVVFSGRDLRNALLSNARNNPRMPFDSSQSTRVGEGLVLAPQQSTTPTPKARSTRMSKVTTTVTVTTEFDGVEAPTAPESPKSEALAQSIPSVSLTDPQEVKIQRRLRVAYKGLTHEAKYSDPNADVFRESLAFGLHDAVSLWDEADRNGKTSDRFVHRGTVTDTLNAAIRVVNAAATANDLFVADELDERRMRALVNLFIEHHVEPLRPYGEGETPQDRRIAQAW